MDFSPPSLLCLLREVFSLRLFFPATVLALSLARDASGLRVRCLSCFRCTCAFNSGQPTTFKYCNLSKDRVLARVTFIRGFTCIDAFKLKCAMSWFLGGLEKFGTFWYSAFKDNLIMDKRTWPLLSSDSLYKHTQIFCHRQREWEAKSSSLLQGSKSSSSPQLWQVEGGWSESMWERLWLADSKQDCWRVSSAFYFCFLTFVLFTVETHISDVNDPTWNYNKY